MCEVLFRKFSVFLSRAAIAALLITSFTTLAHAAERSVSTASAGDSFYSREGFPRQVINCRAATRLISHRYLSRTDSPPIFDNIPLYYLTSIALVCADGLIVAVVPYFDEDGKCRLASNNADTSMFSVFKDVACSSKMIVIDRNRVRKDRRYISLIDDQVCIALTGISSDCAFALESLRQDASDHRSVFGESIPLDLLVDKLSARLHAQTLKGDKRPLAVSLLMAEVPSRRKSSSDYGSSTGGRYSEDRRTLDSVIKIDCMGSYRSMQSWCSSQGLVDAAFLDDDDSDELDDFDVDEEAKPPRRDLQSILDAIPFRQLSWREALNQLGAAVGVLRSDSLSIGETVSSIRRKLMMRDLIVLSNSEGILRSDDGLTQSNL